jgi:hypothetical protein
MTSEYGPTMPLGIGGGAFGVRGGISTRGIGFGVGPLSAGTSWRGGGSSGGGGLIAWLFAAAVLFFIAAWPFLIGTYIAVKCGAWNPSTERLVVGWLFEVVYIAGLLAWFMWSREDRSQRAAEEAQRIAALTASGVVYEAKSGNSVIYRHGTCVVNHRSSETAAGCTKSSPGVFQEHQDATPVSDNPLAADNWIARSSVRWPVAILVVGFVVGLVILLVDPIHSVAEDAASKPCPTHSVTSSTSAHITLPEITGVNAATAESQLKRLGIANVVLTSANPDYKSVWMASNWTVVSMDPAPGCAVGSADRVGVYVTK